MTDDITHSMTNLATPGHIENHTYDEIKVGDTATIVRTLRAEDIRLFAMMSGEMDPAHVDPQYAHSSVFREVISHGMWGGALISTLLGTRFPGPGMVYVQQTLEYSRPLGVGDTVTVTLTCRQKFDHNHHILFDCRCANQDEFTVIAGSVEVLAPTEKIKRLRMPMAEFTLNDRQARYDHLISITKGLSPIAMAVVHPCDRESLKGAVMAKNAGLIVPLLIGPLTKLHALAEEIGISLDGCTLIDVPHSHAAAEMAVQLARAGEVDALMKGSLHSDELLAAVIDKDCGLRTSRRISHVFLMDVPTYPRPLMITDAAVNVEPTLEDKVDIVQNAIDMARTLGIEEPKVAILAAIEHVNPKMRATLDAAALCKMAERGQITGGVLDGPLAFDNAVSLVAAKTKGLHSAVAGQADILVVPDIESGNMLAKQLEYLADALAAGIVLGAKVPIVLTSRADSAETRTASTAVAVVLAHAKQRG